MSLPIDFSSSRTMSRASRSLVAFLCDCSRQITIAFAPDATSSRVAWRTSFSRTGMTISPCTSVRSVMPRVRDSGTSGSS